MTLIQRCEQPVEILEGYQENYGGLAQGPSGVSQRILVLGPGLRALAMNNPS